MFQMYPDAIRDGLAQARKRTVKRGENLCVQVGDQSHRILRIWDDGFALAAKTAPRLFGPVKINDGSRNLYQCVITGSSVTGRERIFAFKWAAEIPDRPPADFVREADAPAALSNG